MNLDFHATSVGTLRRQLTLAITACLALALGIAVLLASYVSKHDRIVIVPPGLTGPVAVDWGKADAEYIKAFGLFYATLLGTITPGNATYIADRLSGMTSADAYPQIRKNLLSIGKDEEFSGSGAAINFVSSGIEYEPAFGRVFVIGESRVQTGYGQPRVTPTIYEIDVRIVEGRPIAQWVTNYVGNEAHTAEWKKFHPDWNKRKPSQQAQQ